jgi:tetratricopeptide (TPR) repeat protein
MPYDLFVSYSRRDNERGQVAALKAAIESSFHAFAGRELRVFFDTRELGGMDDWRHKIQRSLRESQVFLAVLSPNYLASPHCRWEWEDYVRYEAMRQCLGEGIAPVFFVTLPDASDPRIDQAIARWIDEIQRRQTFDLRPWHDAGEQALQQAHVRCTLEELHASVRARLDRAGRSQRSPSNLIKHNPAFVGRVRELTELRNILTKNKLGVVGVHTGQMHGHATVQGLGGMGKTELALAYAHAFAWDYPGGRWQIPCEHVNDLRVALVYLANANALDFEFTEEEKKNMDRAFERVLRELNRCERCLLILDNVSDGNLLQPEYLDRLPRDGRVDLIATTRLAPRAIPGAANEQSFIAVDELPEEDALALMRSHQPEGCFGSQEEDDEARAIVRLLRGFTLAVETAAVYLGRNIAPDACRRFRKRLSPDLLKESETAASDATVAIRHRVRSLEETLSFTLQTLSAEAMHLLRISSLLPADQIALPWLKEVGARKYSAFAAEPTEPNSAFLEAEELLLGLRLFQSKGLMDSNRSSYVVRMHRLVQEIVRRNDTAELRVIERRLLTHAKERAKRIFDKWVEEDCQWETRPLVSYAWYWLKSEHPDGSFLAYQVAYPLRQLGQVAEAERLLRTALQVDVLNHGEQSVETTQTLNQLADLLRYMGNLTEAEELARRAVRSRAQDVVGEAMNRAELAKVLMEKDRVSEAETLLRQSLSELESHLGPSHAKVATCLSVLSLLLMRTSRLEEAEPLARRCAQIYENALGTNHPYVASALGQLGQLMQLRGELAEAEHLARKALAIDEAVYGKDNPEVAIDLSNLAGLLMQSGKKTEAERMMQRSLMLSEKHLGQRNPQVAVQMSNLALVLIRNGKVSDGLDLGRKSLDCEEAIFGRNHPRVAGRMAMIAEALEQVDRFSEAEELLRRALQILAAPVGSNDAVSTYLEPVASAYVALLQKMGLAEPLALERANEILRSKGKGNKRTE